MSSSGGTGHGTGAALTEGVDCAMAAAALEALYAEVRRCRLQGEQEGGAAASVDYEACLAAFAEDVELG